jgi:hypothetical protein
MEVHVLCKPGYIILYVVNLAEKSPVCILVFIIIIIYLGINIH